MKFNRVLPSLLFSMVLNAAAVGTVFAADLLLGEVHPLTGPGAYWGVPMNQAMQIAVEQINQAGGVQAGNQKYPIKLIAADDQTNPTTGVAALRKVIADGAHYVIGPLSSGVAPALKPIIESNPAVTQLIDGAVLEGITTGKNIFRNQPVISDGYNFPIVTYVKSKGFPRVAILTDRFHTGMFQSQATVVAGLEENGNKVVSQEFFKLRDTDFSAQVTNALATRPDILVVRGYGDESTLITKTARQFGYKGGIIWQSQAPADTVLKNISSAEMQGVISVYPQTAGEYAQAGNKNAALLVDAFKKKFNTLPGELSPFSYDAVYILKAAIRKAGSIDNAVVNAALATLTASDVPELVNKYELGAGGRLFDDKGQVKVYGIPHIWKGNDWSQGAD